MKKVEKVLRGRLVKMDERLERLLASQKKSGVKRKMGNTSNVWSKEDLKKATIVIGDKK